jgi:hypothetical protein
MLQISKDLPLNPIIQDSKKGKPRFVHNCFPHHGYIWNYGAIPQVRGFRQGGPPLSLLHCRNCRISRRGS